MPLNRVFHRKSVPSGTSYISFQKEVILEAFLGSCVGLALFDREAKVGGLIHLLLPEPVSHNDFSNSENYATVGIPLFINQLEKKGAQRKKLEAYIAGGALVGPVDETDLMLDIGGRNVDAVEKILEKEGIEIVKSETGGYFTCRMELNLKDWEIRVEPVSITDKPSSAIHHLPTEQEISQTIESIKPIPQIALKVLRMVRDDWSGMKEIAREIKQDQVISARVIRISNSAFFSRGTKIDSIDRALVILGEKMLLPMVLSASVEHFFPDREQGYSLCKGGLFNHALGTALVSEELSRYIDYGTSDIAYTAGLLHDIGKVVLDQYIAKAFPLFYRGIEEDGRELVSIEKKELGITHTEVGSMLAQKWDLPENLIEVIRFHHRPEEAPVHRDLTHLVYLADLLMSRFVIGYDLERLDTELLASRLNALGLDVEDFPAVIERIPRQIFG